ncbi:hypothetical protein Tsubulata_021733 [Turnera subulata]|uniref:Oleosin n=1 Tax=Turnera subulata TaxID=218843 RepID=A0A9Q0F1K8_9ROSI|nr:hypothetical protein Tsubulata_021733 [Turnera subulata]
MTEERRPWMADLTHHPGGGAQRVPGWSLFCASLAAVAVGGPLLAMSGLGLLATLALLLISSPLLLIAGPLLIGAALFLVGCMAAFDGAMVAELAGLYTFTWMFRSASRGRDYGGHVMDEVKERGKDWGNNLQQKVHENNPLEDEVNI